MAPIVPATSPTKAYSTAKVAATPRRVIPSVFRRATSRPRRAAPALIAPARMAIPAASRRGASGSAGRLFFLDSRTSAESVLLGCCSLPSALFVLRLMM